MNKVNCFGHFPSYMKFEQVNNEKQSKQWRNLTIELTASRTIVSSSESQPTYVVEKKLEKKEEIQMEKKEKKQA